MIVQIYEIQTPSEAQSLIDLGVDHIGSVILSASEWQDPAIRAVVRLTQSAGRRSSLIPLFKTFEQPEAVRQLLEYYRPDIVHFCDSLCDGQRIRDACRKMVAFQALLKRQFPDIAIMRSIPIAPAGFARRVPTFELAELFEANSDYFLTDTLIVGTGSDPEPSTAAQPVDGFIGITGRTCDWDTARRLVQICSIPVILAGGISPENVTDGLSAVQPDGVDSCTGTNAVDDAGRPVRFKKDPEKVGRLVESARRFQPQLLRPATTQS